MTESCEFSRFTKLLLMAGFVKRNDEIQITQYSRSHIQHPAELQNKKKIRANFQQLVIRYS